MIEEGSAIWYKGWVRVPAGLAGVPAGEKFTVSQAIVWRRLTNGKWLVYNDADTYLILSTDQARQALKSCRDAQHQPAPAEDQAAVCERFTRVTSRQRS